jgi:hypothetical protein
MADIAIDPTISEQVARRSSMATRYTLAEQADAYQRQSRQHASVMDIRTRGSDAAGGRGD